jgi:hypothetical protein
MSQQLTLVHDRLSDGKYITDKFQNDKNPKKQINAKMLFSN